MTASAGAVVDQDRRRLLSEAKKDGGGPGDDGAGVGAGAEITIKEWSPGTPYLAALKRAPSGAAAYGEFLKARPAWGMSPAFYLDCAEEIRRKGDARLARRVLTDIADLQLEEPQLMRVVAHRLRQLGRRDAAIALFRDVLRLRPEEPQSYRDLALALSDRADDAAAGGNASAALGDYQAALSLLAQVVMRDWDRFDQIETIALMEANRIIARAQPLAAKAGRAFTPPLDSRLVKNLPCDVRIVMTWDTDQTDMDLHVVEPSEEECYYGHNRTAIGGRMSRDFTDGYGPEEYLLRRAPNGGYQIRSNYFGTRQQTLTGGTTVQAAVITDWGRPTEKRRELTLRLSREKETIDIGTVRL
jgi:tetratricopeptide (TPR) repeat protein